MIEKAAAETDQEYVVPFGKYAGQKISSVTGDEKYLRWLVTQPWYEFSLALKNEIETKKIGNVTGASQVTSQGTSRV